MECKVLAAVAVMATQVTPEDADKWNKCQMAAEGQLGI